MTEFYRQKQNQEVNNYVVISHGFNLSHLELGKTTSRNNDRDILVGSRLSHHA